MTVKCLGEKSDLSTTVNRCTRSSTYQETSAQLNAIGLLVGQTSVEVFEMQAGFLDLQALAPLLENAKHDPAPS